MWMLKSHYKLIMRHWQKSLAALDRYENEKTKPGMCVFVRIKASVVQFWEATGRLTSADRRETWCDLLLQNSLLKVGYVMCSETVFCSPWL